MAYLDFEAEEEDEELRYYQLPTFKGYAVDERSK